MADVMSNVYANAQILLVCSQGVPAMAIKNKMVLDGLDPSLLE